MPSPLQIAEGYTKLLSVENPRYAENYSKEYHLRAAQGQAMRKLLFHLCEAIVDAIDRRPRG
jgi:hypothetical protein